MKQKVIFIVGPTGSGKTKLAINLAKAVNGQVICADSRTIYRDINIGTAKPTQQEMMSIPHHLINLRDLNEQFSVSDFASIARSKIEAITKQGSLAIVCGGTGLYINSILYNYNFRTKKHINYIYYENLTLDQVTSIAIKKGVRESIIASKNPRRIVQAIEWGNPSKLKINNEIEPYIIYLKPNRTLLIRNLEHRINMMIQNGLILELEQLKNSNLLSIASTKGSAYKHAESLLTNLITINEYKLRLLKDDASLAKRQCTWFNKTILSFNHLIIHEINESTLIDIVKFTT